MYIEFTKISGKATERKEMPNEESNASQIVGILGCAAIIFVLLLLGGFVWFAYEAATSPNFWQ